jgi:hypothetical protein
MCQLRITGDDQRRIGGLMLGLLRYMQVAGLELGDEILNIPLHVIPPNR